MPVEFQRMSKIPAKVQVSLTKAVRDHYRCPDGFLDFRLNDGISGEPGYFWFGAGAECYGRTLPGVPASQPGSPLRDTLHTVVRDGDQLVLPFDPNEVIDNFRLERYPSSQMGKVERALKSIYYGLRPLTNLALRRTIQKLRAAHWQKKQFPRWPVDTGVENICEKLFLLSIEARGVDRIPFIWFWPEGARGCITMTHDVESAVGRDFCAQLLDIDSAFGIKSSYQIVPEGRYSVTAEFLNRLRAQGSEICVQDLNHDGRLFDERDQFRRRALSINRYGREYGARGFRSAVLYRNPDWYGDLDFSFDMSIPNVASLDPQRGGCCTVFPYFIGDMLELPVTAIQDYSLFHVLSAYSIDLWRLQLEMILARNGLASFIVHPDYVIESNAQAVYKDLLAMLVEAGRRDALWFALPSQVDRWWRQRNQMSIIDDHGTWRIVGEGADRAVLAFARVVDGQLVYEKVNTPQGELALSAAK